VLYGVVFLNWVCSLVVYFNSILTTLLYGIRFMYRMYLWIWKGDRLDKKFNLDMKDINEHPGIDYEVSKVAD